jgi:hypothetical protein
MEISITLNPGKLSNPDADLRYIIPDEIEKASDKALEDNGYDYDDNQNMIIFIENKSLSEDDAVNLIRKMLTKLQIENEAFIIDTNV